MIDKDRVKYQEKKKARINRVCMGHWINKGMNLRNKECYEDGVCMLCGGKQK